MVSLNNPKLITFVWILFLPQNLWSAPGTEVEVFKNENIESHHIEQMEDKIDQKSVSVGKIINEQPRESKKTYFFPYKQSMSPQLGILLNAEKLKDGDLPLLIGIQYLIPRHRPPQWEAAFSISTDGEAYISLGLRKIENPRRYFRPYGKLSGTLVADADERFATITDINNYFIKGTVGIEDVVKIPMSIRLEAELAVGLESQFALLNIGYSWAW